MHHNGLTIKKTLWLSVTMHVALFGSALAVAQYGRSFFPEEMRLRNWLFEIWRRTP